MLALCLLLPAAPTVVPALTGAPSSAPCVPRSGKTLIAIGQDRDSIADYAAAFGTPAVVSAYTALDSLLGLDSPTDYGGGVQHAAALLEAYPSTSLLLAVYAVGDLANVTSGRRDARIDALGDWIARARVPVYLRFGYECDNPSNKYEPAAFVAAFRYVTTRLRARGVPNVAFVWHSWGFEPAGGRPVLDWFPGVEYADWVGLSAFQQLLTRDTTHMENVASIAKAHGLPLMICESTPFGGLQPAPAPRTLPLNTTAHRAVGRTAVRGGASPPPPAPPAPRKAERDTWGSWFSPLLSFVRAHDVRLLAYIDCDWSSQPMWAGQGWGDTRLEAEPRHARLWRNRVLNHVRYTLGPFDRGCEPGTTMGVAPAPPPDKPSHHVPLPAGAAPARVAPAAAAAQHTSGEHGAAAISRQRASRARTVWCSLVGVGVLALGALGFSRRVLLGRGRTRLGEAAADGLLAGEQASAASGAAAGAR
ncbi:hypothetical protein KFE25_001929 [Diacronema lutheri]|uniref:GH26 domain-containing protein n=3 Tax=Diacronema lutheri TaxID=2081491 RepID=A0A8J5XFJ4_DIALT|nr:hypothetical protein KFE25_001929 [Diacronema lutheri]